MRLATVRLDGGLRAVRVDDDAATLLDAADVGELLADPDWRDRAAAASGRRSTLDELDYAPLVPRPDKIICVGLELPRPPRRDGSRGAGVPDGVRQVPRRR